VSILAQDAGAANVESASEQAEHHRRGLSVRAVVFALVIFNLVRFAFAFTFELMPQEAYYFLYSQHLALSYFDHPPAIAYFIRLFTSVLGANELALRTTAFALTTATQLAWLRFAARLLPVRIWSRAALLFASTGFITVASLISTPDVPLLLFWTLSLDQLYRAIFEGRRQSWLLAGLTIGLAFDSKYSGIFLQLGLLLFLALSRSHRRLLKTPWPYLCLAVAHLTMLPIYIWNAQHGFVSFLFQSAERAQAIGEPRLRYLLALLATQSALLMPPLLLALGWAIGRLLFLRRKRLLPVQSKQLFLACFFVPMALTFISLSVFTLVKPNWLMPCYLSGILWLAPYVGRWWKWNLAFAAVLHVAAAIELVFYVFPIQSDDTWFGWRELAQRMNRISAGHPNAFVFSVDSYKTSAELSFYLGSAVYGPNVVHRRGLQFDYLGDDLGLLRGRDALLVNSAPRDLSPGRSGRPPELTPYFESVEELEPVLIFNQDRLVRKFFIYLCRHYRGIPQ
jgi:4-amino-4-deoxy-L-arabinose transferase-like glycosyltransferase